MANTKITSRVIADDAILTAAIADDQITSALIADDVALGGNPTTTTQSAGNNTTRIATTAFVSTAISNLVDSSPSALDTLNELAAALGDDANFSTTVTNSIATKLAASGANQTLADSGNLTLDVAGNIVLDADSGEIQLKDGGTTFAELVKSGNDLRINQGIQDGDIVLRGNDGGSVITALTLDMSDAGKATFNSFVKAPRFGAGINPIVPVDILSTGATSTALRVLKSGSDDSTQNNLFSVTEISGHGRLSIHDSAQNEDIRFDSNGDSYFNGGNLGVGTTSPSKKLEVDGNVKFGNVGKVETGTNTFKASSTGSNGFFLRSAVSSVSNPSISDVDDTDTGMYFPAANTLGLATGGTNILRVKQSNSQPQYTFGTNNTANGLHGPSFVACLASGSVGTNYFFQLYEAEDNFSAASLKLGGLLASSSYALANPDRGDIYVQDNISAASVTDRTPYPTSLQLAKDVINSHQRRSEEEITRLATAQYNKIQAKDEMPQPEREALSLEEYLEKYKKEYELDHSVLHDYVNDTKYADVGIEGRDASATVSCLVEVVKDLMKRLEALENG